MNMENEKKWRLLKNSDIKKIHKSRFNKSDDFVGKNIPTSRREKIEVHLPPTDDDTLVLLTACTQACE